MTGLHVNDTYGSMFNVDQLCECKLFDGLRVGDTVVLETDQGSFPFDVALIESYVDEQGHPGNVMGVGLDGPQSELVMPGDTLRVESKSGPESAATAFVHVPVDNGHHIEIHRQLITTN